MSGVHGEPDEHATPLTPEEREGLIPAHITLRRELNEAEQQNILKAAMWAFDRKRPLFTEEFARNLHKRMYGEVWRWAGTYRTTGKNLGVDPHLIPVRLYEAMNQFKYWQENKILASDELAIRFHHALVVIHPFPNGNGRWSRMMADLLGHQLGIQPLTWGGDKSDLRESGDIRRAYIQALKAADDHDFRPLLAFARS